MNAETLLVDSAGDSPSHSSTSSVEQRHPRQAAPSSHRSPSSAEEVGGRRVLANEAIVPR